MLYSRSLFVIYFIFMASLVVQLIKNPPAMQETWVQSLDWEDPLEKGEVTHSSISAWRSPWIQSMDSTKSWTRLSDFHFHFIFIVVCMCQLPFPSLYFPFSPCNHKFVFYICDSISVL